jgi:hypothetical protein
MTKIKNFRVTLRAREMARWLKKERGLDHARARVGDRTDYQRSEEMGDSSGGLHHSHATDLGKNYDDSFAA